MALFPLPVKAEMPDAMKLPSRVLQFGDGAEQTASDGLNRSIEIWDVTIIISDAPSSVLLQNFLIEYGQHKSFEWKSPRDSSFKNYRITGSVGGTTRNGGGSKPVFFTRTMQFKQLKNTAIIQPITISISSPTTDEDTVTLQPLIITLNNYNSLEG